MIMSYYDHFLDLSTTWCYNKFQYNKPRSLLLAKELKGKNVLQHSMQNDIHHSFDDICNLNNQDCYI